MNFSDKWIGEFSDRKAALQFKLVLFLVSLFWTTQIPHNAFAADVEAASRPEWIDSQSRHIVGGDILHVGTGIGKSPEIARFKAESMAVRNLISECSLAHRDTVIWDRYLEHLPNGTYQGYARAGMSYSACEEARNAKGEDRKKLSNSVLVKNQDLYDQLEKEDTNQNSLMGRIQAWTRALVGKSENRLDALEQRIKELEQSPAQQNVTIIEQKTVLVGGAASRATRYRDCMDEYKQLMQEAQDRALASNPLGNLASPQAAPAYNRALRKQTYCEQIK